MLTLYDDKGCTATNRGPVVRGEAVDHLLVQTVQLRRAREGQQRHVLPKWRRTLVLV